MFTENVLLSTISLPELTESLTAAILPEIEKRLKVISETPTKTEFLTRHEAAKLLGVSLPTLLDWTKEGLITAYRISSRIRYKRHEVETALTQLRYK